MSTKGMHKMEVLYNWLTFAMPGYSFELKTLEHSGGTIYRIFLKVDASYGQRHVELFHDTLYISESVYYKLCSSDARRAVMRVATKNGKYFSVRKMRKELKELGCRI